MKEEYQQEKDIKQRGYMLIGERLAEIRTKHNMTQERFAEQLGVSRQAVSKWELDKTLPDIEKLLKISELYQVSIDYILKGTQETSDLGNTETYIDSVQECALDNRYEDTGDVGDAEDVEDVRNAEDVGNVEIKERNLEADKEKTEKQRISAGANKHITASLGIRIVLVSILLLGVAFIFVVCLIQQVWNKSENQQELVRVDKVYAQYSIADVSSYTEGGTPVTKTVFLDTKDVRSGDYIYCYTNTAKNSISVDYSVSTILIIFSVFLILLIIWILLIRELRKNE